MAERVPVLIAAYNEEVYIGGALDVLPAKLVEPIVIANGCTDGTAEIARSFGATVLETETQGKMPAIQLGLRKLGDQALGSVLFLDADAAPDFPGQWSRIMTSLLESGPESAAVAGPVRYVGEQAIGNTLRSTRLYARHIKTRLGIGRPNPQGINMGIRPHTQEVLDEILDMEHLWLGEDRAMVDLVVEQGGSFVQCINPKAMVHASDRTLAPLVNRLRMTRAQAIQASQRAYALRAAPGSTPYINPNTEPLPPRLRPKGLAKA